MIGRGAAFALILILGGAMALFASNRLSGSYFLKMRPSDDTVQVFRGVPGWDFFGYPLLLERTDVKRGYVTMEAARTMEAGASVPAPSVPDEMLTPLGRGLLAFDRNKYQDAVAILKPITVSDPGNDRALEFLARAQIQVGDKKGATETLQRLWEVSSDNAWASNTLGDLAVERKDLAEAEKRYNQTLKLAPHDAHALTRMADLYVDSGRIHLDGGLLEAADADFRTALRYNPSSSSAKQGLAAVVAARQKRGGQINLLKARVNDSQGREKFYFSKHERGLFLHLTFHNETPEIAHQHELRTVLVRPDRKPHGRAFGGTIRLAPGQDLKKKDYPLDVDSKGHNGYYIRDSLIAEHPGKYEWVIYLDGKVVERLTLRIQ
ncbi:MAG: tetratricopeptide repeat protein [Armatimonadetes bacterium]|nr:tetratricopeptide repeat protein [Armatimonadota bacterium]